MTTAFCEHNYVFKGLIYSHGAHMPGSDARYRTYEDAYYCSKCLHSVFKNAREIGSSYDKPIQGAMPK